jgi:alpha-L-glutamate ligase-like protein
MKWIRPQKLSEKGILGMNCRNLSYIGRFNDRKYFPLVDNKLSTKQIAARAGLKVPELLNVIRHQHEVETIEEILEGRSEFVIKPAQGSGGKGILVVHDRSESSFQKSNGDTISVADVKRHLSNIIRGLHSLGGRSDVAIIEELVQITPEFERLSHEGVPDIRLIVFKGFPVMGMLRLASVASDGKANLHQGAVGVGLDIGSGRSISAVQYDRPISRHPDTSEPLEGIVIPRWRDLLMLTSRCFEATQLGYLGCDIVIDGHKGPLLLEMNARPGLSIQIANDEGLLPRLEFIEAQQAQALNVGQRVDLAMEWFDRSPQGSQAEMSLQMI